MISLAATQVMNLAFIGWIEHAGLALSIGLAACLNAGLLYRGLRQHGIYTPQPGWLIFSLKLLLAMIVMAAALWFTMGNPASWLAKDVLGRIIHLSWLVPLGAASYFATLWVLGFRLRDFKHRAAE
jgi:putative peptidoglycan lipid II flippase